jgi:hypothetical protein
VIDRGRELLCVPGLQLPQFDALAERVCEHGSSTVGWSANGCTGSRGCAGSVVAT